MGVRSIISDVTKLDNETKNQCKSFIETSLPDSLFDTENKNISLQDYYTLFWDKKGTIIFSVYSNNNNEDLKLEQKIVGFLTKETNEFYKLWIFREPTNTSDLLTIYKFGINMAINYVNKLNGRIYTFIHKSNKRLQSIYKNIRCEKTNTEHKFPQQKYANNDYFDVNTSDWYCVWFPKNIARYDIVYLPLCDGKIESKDILYQVKLFLQFYNEGITTIKLKKKVNTSNVTKSELLNIIKSLQSKYSRIFVYYVGANMNKDDCTSIPLKKGKTISTKKLFDNGKNSNFYMYIQGFHFTNHVSLDSKPFQCLNLSSTSVTNQHSFKLDTTSCISSTFNDDLFLNKGILHFRNKEIDIDFTEKWIESLPKYQYNWPNAITHTKGLILDNLFSDSFCSRPNIETIRNSV